MSFTNHIHNKNDYQIISIDTLNDIINEQSSSPLQESYLNIENYIIASDYIFINTKTQQNISFKNCYFTGYLSLEGCEFNGYLHFEECYFDEFVSLNKDLIVKGELKFQQCSINNSFSLQGGVYDNIYLSFNNDIKITLYSGSFKLLNIGQYIGYGTIKELTILYHGNTFDSNSSFGNISITNKKIENIYIGGINKSNSYNFDNLEVNIFSISNLTNDGQIRISNIRPIKGSKDDAYFSIEKSNLGKTQFYNLDFNLFYEFIFIDSIISDSAFVNIKWPKILSTRISPTSYEFNKETRKYQLTKEQITQLREAYKQFKNVVDKQGDKVQENKFHELEMNTYNNLLSWKTDFWNKLIIYSSDFFSKYGQSLLRPIIFILIFNFVFFILINFSSKYPIYLTEIKNHSEYALAKGIKEYFILINPTHKLDENYYGIMVFWDLLSRISSSFFIYNIIRATRRFTK